MFSSLKDYFLLDPNIVYLNHGSFGACLKPVFDNLIEWQKKIEMEPVKFFENTVIDALEESRKALGKYVNCSADDLVYFPNPTTALNAVARSLKLKPGDEVLSTNHIYGALDRMWKYVCDEKKVNFVKAEIPFSIQSNQHFFNIFIKYINDRTKVIFISHITSMTAMIFPVKEIIKFAKEKNILIIVDGAHVPGHIPLDLIALDADIYTGACHKWMCTPKGVSFLYVKKELQHKIHPLIISWGWESETPGPSKFLDWHEWQGTRDMSAFLTVPIAIKFLDNNNWLEVSEECKKLTIKTKNNFLEMLKIPSLCSDNYIGQMASIPIPVDDEVKFRTILLSKYKIQVPVFRWNKMTILRYSIQAYNTDEDINKLLNAVEELLA